MKFDFYTTVFWAAILQTTWARK